MVTIASITITFDVHRLSWNLNKQKLDLGIKNLSHLKNIKIIADQENLEIKLTENST